ncbi:MAG: hypothetical protein ONB16_00170 [candidate division KSB1 bacterium]|nr:hypothetical protein [candidate division KSB1 bacterium]MDZ7319201.1 hypothetical protein [candidate division KSB1 bacterium]MDZ7340326.1 hypothetical protein [candidate division KSB1 bacterium]
MFLFKLIRVIIFWVLVYLIYKLLKNIFQAPAPRSTIKGTPRNQKPLDVSDADIEDAKFKEL